MSFTTASAILRGKWLIDKGWVQSHLPLVVQMMKGQAVDFGLKKEEIKEPSALSHQSGSVYRVGYYTDLGMLPPNSIAMYQIIGPVMKYGDMCSYGSVDHVQAINRLALANNVDGIILDVDSPGGEAAGTAMVADAIKNAGLIKPVIAIIQDGIAASAAMWMISPATEIYTTQKTDMVGSVGVYTTVVDWYGYFKEEGLNVRDVYAPQSTEKNIEYLQALEGNDELLKDELKVLATEFINAVKNNRGDKLTSDEWNKGKMFYTPDAKRIGLIDGQKSFDEVVKRMDSLIKQNKKQQNTNSNNNYNTMKFPNLATLFGKKEISIAAETQLEEKHAEDVEATITERDSLKAESNSLKNDNASLKTENDQLKASVSEKDATIATLTSDKETLSTENAALKTKVETLEKSDGQPATEVVTEKDEDPVIADVQANDMAFQKELYNKI